MYTHNSYPTWLNYWLGWLHYYLMLDMWIPCEDDVVPAFSVVAHFLLVSRIRLVKYHPEVYFLSTMLHWVMADLKMNMWNLCMICGCVVAFRVWWNRESCIMRFYNICRELKCFFNLFWMYFAYKLLLLIFFLRVYAIPVKEGFDDTFLMYTNNWKIGKVYIVHTNMQRMVLYLDISR